MSASRVMNVEVNWRHKVTQGYEHVNADVIMRESYGRFLQKEPSLFKQRLVMRYNNLARSDFIRLCNFSDRDWFNYFACKELYKDCAKPGSSGTEDTCTVLTCEQFKDWIGDYDNFTYELYLTMNLLEYR